MATISKKETLVRRTTTEFSLAARLAQRPESRVMVTQVGLHLPEEIDYETWERSGRTLARAASSTSWCLGDWINYGESKYADRYKAAIGAAGLEYKTIRNYAWVARRIEISRRKPLLSFQHHAEVASLQPHEQDIWLTQAETRGWSRNELRRNIRGNQETKQPDIRKALLQLANDEHIERWSVAAEQAESRLKQWIVTTLDAAAESLIHENHLPLRPDPLEETPNQK